MMMQTFEQEARQMAGEEHYALEIELEMMRSDPEYTWQDIAWKKQEEKWAETPGEFFTRNRDHFLEQAREWFAQGVTA